MVISTNEIITQGEKDQSDVNLEVNDILNVSTSVQTEKPLLKSTTVQTGYPFSKEAIVQTDLTSLPLTLFFNDMNFTNSLILQLKAKLKGVGLIRHYVATSHFLHVKSYRFRTTMPFS